MGKLSYNKSMLNGCLLQGYRNVISWDIYGTGNFITELGWKKLFEYFLSLPLEAYKINKRCMNFSFSSSGYSYIEFSKEYIKLKLDVIFKDIENILKNREYMNEPELGGFKLDYKEIDKYDFKVWEKFKKECDELKEKYSYWIKKKKENSNYNRYKILERDGFKCKICGRTPPEVVLHIDHWIPKARGGLDIYENLVTLCGECNISKSAQVPKFPITYVRDKIQIKEDKDGTTNK